MEKQDTMLVLVAEAFKNADNYLKENDKNAIAALVLAGGWLESMFIAVDAAKTSNNPKIIERIGDQKNALKSLIEMLEQYNNNRDYADLLIELEGLYEVFESIDYTYEFIPPVTDEPNKTTTIKSKHNVDMGNDALSTIIENVETIRNDIVD